MKVLKFGGTSVGSAAGIENIRNIISGLPGSKLLVLSAMSGVTNSLVEISSKVKDSEFGEINDRLNELRNKHFGLIDQLIPEPDSNTKIKRHIESIFAELGGLCYETWTLETDARILTTGESLLTFIFSSFLKYKGIGNTLLNAKDFMHVDNLENPDTVHIGELLNDTLRSSEDNEILITQGFLRINA
ncbi:MAG: aspartate kinase, partial [Christiangramia sp.]